VGGGLGGGATCSINFSSVCLFLCSIATVVNFGFLRKIEMNCEIMLVVVVVTGFVRNQCYTETHFGHTCNILNVTNL